jgi:deazaflavin-dependent oxidoreductase (nitroreductase family)
MSAHGTRLAWISPFTKRVVNPLTRRFAGRLAWFGIVTHVGRRSGRVYHTPLNVFRHGDGYVFALTYGPDVDWVRNVRAAGGCTMRSGGRTVRLTDPQLVHDPSGHLVPQPVRAFLRVLGVTDYLVAREAAAALKMVGGEGLEPPTSSV